MPLIHSSSNKARQENIKRELEAHPDMNPKQAVAISYSVQRKAEGGPVTESEHRVAEREVYERNKYGY